MSTLTWLHLSDFHFHASPSHDRADVLDALLRDIAAQVQENELRPDCIFVTGDIAFSGQPAEYKLAGQFFDTLLQTVGLAKERLFLIPGNHDIDRSRVSPLASRAMEVITNRDQINQILADASDRAIFFAALRNYGNFVNHYLGSHFFDDEHYFYVRTLKIAGWRVAVLGLNSAWLSQSDADYGRLALGERQVREALDQTGGADLKIALMHHPFSWLHESDRAISEPLLMRNCDFILHSSLHSKIMEIGPRPGAKALSIGAHTIPHPGAHREPTGYNFCQLDLAAGSGRVFLRRFADDRGWVADISTPGDSIYSFEVPRKEPAAARAGRLSPGVAVPKRIHLHTLNVKNFRGFAEESFQLGEEFTVLIGDNGSGKTATLEALAIGVGAFFWGLDGGFSVPRIERDQVRLASFRHGDTLSFEEQYPVEVGCAACWGDYEFEWKLAHAAESDITTGRDVADMISLAQYLQSRVREGEDVVLPVIAYYGTGRLWKPPSGRPEGAAVEDMIEESGSRLRAYQGCLEPASHVDELVRWVARQEWAAFQKREPPKVYKALKEALETCIEGFQDLRYDPDRDDICICLTGERELLFHTLSEGVRNMLAMVTDIVRRAAVLNPQFAEQAAQKTPGIVLIDEIDLHLHPNWQRRVVEDLRRTFPRMQFIATTHSPFIIQSLRSGELIDLEKGPGGEYVNRSIEDIAESLMGVPLPQRSQRYQEMYNAAKEYYRVLREGSGATEAEKEKLEQKLDELAAPFSDDVAYNAFLEMERMAAGLGEDDETR